MKAKMERDRQRREVVKSYEEKRQALKGLSKNELLSEEIREQARVELEKLPKDSIPNRVRNRCIISGRSRSVYRMFKLSRIKLREKGLSGRLAGVKKASW